MAIVAAVLGLGLESVQASPQRGAVAVSCPAILNHTFERLQDEKPLWNFHKYLIGRDGKVIDQYSSLTGTESKTLLSAIDKALKAQP